MREFPGQKQRQAARLAAAVRGRDCGRCGAPMESGRVVCFGSEFPDPDKAGIEADEIACGRCGWRLSVPVPVHKDWWLSVMALRGEW